MGLTFKENCPDLRNTKVVDIISELQDYGVKVDCYDPWVNPSEAEHEYGLKPIITPEVGIYDSIVMAVAHKQFADMGVNQIRALGKSLHVLYDIKYLLPANQSDLRL